jgi:hypothetical protein
MARIATLVLALVAVLAVPTGTSASPPHHHSLNWPHALRGERSCGTTRVAANDTSLLVFTRRVGCRLAFRLIHRTTKGHWPKHWWPRQENHKVWIQPLSAGWRSGLRHKRHIRALDLPLGSRTLADGAGDVGSAQYKPLNTLLSGDGSFDMTHTTWSTWRRHQARGQGIGRSRTYRQSPPYFHRVPAEIRAYRPRTKCGVRIFTRYGIRLAHKPRHGRRHFVIKRNWVACNN